MTRGMSVLFLLLASVAWAAYPVTDTFERASLVSGGPCAGGACWTQPVVMGGGSSFGVQISGGALQPVASTTGFYGAVWTVDAAIAPPSYAYATLGPLFLTSKYVMAITALSGGTGWHGCMAAPGLWALVRGDTTGTVQNGNVASGGQTWSVGDRIGIQWDSATSFSCWRQAGGVGAWSNLSGAITDANFTPATGRMGAGFFLP